MLNVTFTPVEYGKMKLGKLIVQTEKKYWSFKVEGTFPKYTPPKKTKLSNISGLIRKRKITERSQSPLKSANSGQGPLYTNTRNSVALNSVAGLRNEKSSFANQPPENFSSFVTGKGKN